MRADRKPVSAQAAESGSGMEKGTGHGGLYIERGFSGVLTIKGVGIPQ